MANKFSIDDYTKSVDPSMTRTGSPLHDFPFTDSLTYDSQFEVDQQGVLTGGIVRTNRSPTRVELNSISNSFDVYEDGVLRASLVSNQLRFLDTTGTLNTTILANSSGDTIFANVNDGTDIIIRTTSDPLSKIILDSPTVEITGTLNFSGTFTFSQDLIPDTDNAYDIGSPTFAWKDGWFAGDVAMNGFMVSAYVGVTDGVTAPSTVLGIAWIYVDTADGDLKIKFGDGTVKTIVTD
jgi:hypothetical protein